jgi:hypothetical protein
MRLTNKDKNETKECEGFFRGAEDVVRQAASAGGRLVVRAVSVVLGGVSFGLGVELLVVGAWFVHWVERV